MQEVFEKIIEKLEEKENEAILKAPNTGDFNNPDYQKWMMKSFGFKEAMKIVQEVAEEYNNGWIPCSKKMPPVETEVFILAKRKYKGKDCRYIRTTAMYEDGTVLENDSCWNWEDIDGEWDEENECYIIQEGWWENRHYNPDEVYNNAIDDEVIAWQPLPAPYQPKGE